MNEVKIDILKPQDNDNNDIVEDYENSYSSESSIDDVSIRKIQGWDKESEEFLENMCDKIDEKIKFHNKNGCKYKYLHYTVGFFSTALPLVSSSFVSLFDNEIVETKLLIIIALVNTVSQFFRLETLHNKNLEYENRFEELKTKIEIELTKPKINRQNCETFILKTSDQFNFLNYTGPN